MLVWLIIYDDIGRARHGVVEECGAGERGEGKRTCEKGKRYEDLQ